MTPKVIAIDRVDTIKMLSNEKEEENDILSSVKLITVVDLKA